MNNSDRELPPSTPAARPFYAGVSTAENGRRATGPLWASAPVRVLLDDLVGADEQRFRNAEAQFLRSLGVDHQLERRRLLHPPRARRFLHVSYYAPDNRRIVRV